MVGNHIADGACGEITANPENFAHLESTISPRGLKREILRARRDARSAALRQATGPSATTAALTPTTGGRPSAAYSLPGGTRQEETSFLRAQLDLMDTDWNGDRFPCNFCGLKPATTSHLFRECPSWSTARSILKVKDGEALWRDPAAAQPQELIARWTQQRERWPNSLGGAWAGEFWGGGGDATTGRWWSLAEGGGGGSRRRKDERQGSGCGSAV